MMADAGAPPADGTRLGNLEGDVLLQAGLERSPSAVVADDNSLLLRVVLYANHREVKVHFEGLWAFWFSLLEPGDRLRIEGAERPALGDPNPVWKAGGSAQVVRAQRGSVLASITRDMLPGKNPPAWLAFPPWRPLAREYQYCHRLCGLRDGEQANLWAVIWENAKPGATFQPGRRLVTNACIVDPSYDALPCSEWTTNPDVAQVSLQIDVRRDVLPQPSHLPCLGVGEVVRAHRFFIQRKAPKFINLWHKRYSTVVRFGSGPDECDPVPVHTDRDHTITEQDLQHARFLRRWAYDRLRQETISAYIKSISELQSAPVGTHGDIVARVFGLDRAAHVLTVSDGSTPEPIRVQVREPRGPNCAIDWLFSHIARGEWVKLRGANHAGLPDPVAETGDSSTLGDGEPSGAAANAPIQVHAAQVTRLPDWCYDVEVRKASVPMPSGASIATGTAAPTGAPVLGAPATAASASVHTNPVAATSATAPTSDFVAAALGTAVAAAPAHATASAVGTASGTTATAAAACATTAATANAEDVRPISRRAAGRTDISAVASPSSIARAVQDAEIRRPPGQRSRRAPRFTSEYARTASDECIPIGEVRSQIAAGNYCLILTGFEIASISGAWTASPVSSTSVCVEDMLCVVCRACECRFPVFTRSGGTAGGFRQTAFGDFDGSIRDAKRRRRELPCKHVFFFCAFEGSIVLKDKTNPSQSVSVRFCDAVGELFGVSPEDAATEPSARQRVQECIDALLTEAPCSSDGTDANENTLSIRVANDGECADRALFVIDTTVI